MAKAFTSLYTGLFTGSPAKWLTGYTGKSTCARGKLFRLQVCCTLSALHEALQGAEAGDVSGW